MVEELQKSISDLFHGKSNVPDAANHCGLSVAGMKACFSDYAKKTPEDDWSIEIEMSWPYC